jgi:hypothetical protein
MLSRRRLALLCALCGAGIAGANEVRVWEGDPTGYQIIGSDSIRILRPGVFKMEALDGAGGLGYIRKIDVQFTGQPGPVTVYVVRDPREVGGSEHEPGASEIWKLDLSGAVTPGGHGLPPTTGTLAELRTTGKYGDTDPDKGGTLNASAAGDIHIGGDVVMPSAITSAIDIGGAITQPLTIGGQLLADLTCESAGDISIAYAGEVNIQIGYTCTSGPYSGTLHMDQSVDTNVTLVRKSFLAPRLRESFPAYMPAGRDSRGRTCEKGFSHKQPTIITDSPEAVPTAAAQSGQPADIATVGTLPGRLKACVMERVLV